MLVYSHNVKRTKNKIPGHILKLYRKLRNIDSIYVDTCFVGYLTDDDRHEEHGDLIVKYFQNYNIKPYVSNLVLEELSALDNELDDTKKLKQMTKLLLKVLNDIGAVPVKNIKVTNEVKEFYEFLLNIGITKNDAAHFTITVFHDIDAFLSFNKKIFVKKKNKIDRKLMILRKKPPVILEVDELYLDLKKLDKYNFI